MAIDLINSPEVGIPPINGNNSRPTSKGFRKRPRLERSRLLSLPSSQSVNRMPSQLEVADQVLNTFQDKPPLDDNLPRPFENLTSLSWDAESRNIPDEALNEFQFEALRDENLARPFEDLDAEALNELFESLNNENLAHPKDHVSGPLAKDTGPQNVEEEALNARPFEFTFCQPPSEMESRDIDHDHEALNEFQFEALRDENLARPFEDLDAEALNELVESLNNENLAHPKDHVSGPLAKDTGPQIVEKEALNAYPSEFTVSQPPWVMRSQDFDQGSSSFQDTSLTNNIAHHSTGPVSDDESGYVGEGSNGSRFMTPANMSHAQPTGHRFSQYT
ncbi:hypothetical protein NUH16_005978 [Penicillium rubens]|jgi:DNA-directed RNA polymerase subunit F|nr:uncharacterized protein N7525_001477 [Penicillium rubens]KAJ5034539.1 hypothetical protein NUH16_005978 [Penicillium rubens]KAJ5843736.1 hypothetical protein N7525_001477 [Penicillium rubens]